MKAVIARSNGQPDWDDVAEIIQKMEIDQSSDEGHFHALKHNADGQIVVESEGGFWHCYKA